MIVLVIVSAVMAPLALIVPFPVAAPAGIVTLVEKFPEPSAVTDFRVVVTRALSVRLIVTFLPGIQPVPLTVI